MAFPQDPNDVDIELFYDAAWNNINQYVYHRDAAPITITRGRANEGKRCDPGTMDCSLNNRDGRFSPRNPNSPLYGKIGRNTQIRVKVTYNAVTYIRFTGEVVSWPSRWDVSGKDIWVPLKAAGILRRLGQGTKPLRSPLFRAIQGSSPADHWPLDDAASAVSAANAVSGGQPMRPNGATLPEFAATAGPAGDLGPLAYLNARSLYATSQSAATTSWAVELAVQAEELGGGNDGQLLFFRTANAEWYLWTQTTTAGMALYSVASAAGGPDMTMVASEQADWAGEWHHYVITATPNGSNIDGKLYFDGQLLLSGTSAAAATASTPRRLYVNAANQNPGYIDMSAGHIAIYNSASDINVADRYQAFLAWAGQQAHARFSENCSQAGISAVVTGSTSQQMGAERHVTLLQSLRDCEDVDQAFLHEQRDAPGLKFRTLSSKYNQIPIPLSYTTKGLAHPLDPEPDDLNVANDREVKRRTGSSVRRELTSGPLSVQDPPDGIGRIDDTITIDAHTDDQLEHIANWRLHVGTWDAERYPRVNINLAANPALIPTIAPADSGDLIIVSDLPSWLPPEDAELIVEGYREVIGFYDWDLTFNMSPAGPYNVVGRWELVAKELQAAINSSGTSIDIANTDVTQPMLATAAADIGSAGYGIKIGGEEMQLTAVAASSITFGAAGTATGADNASVTPGLPASTSTGHLLLVFAAIRNSGTGTVNTPSGYTRLDVFPSTANVQLFAKVAGGAEVAPSVSFTGGVLGATCTAQMARLVGQWHDPTKILIGSAQCLNASAQNITYPGLSLPSADRCIIIALGWKQDDWTSVATLAGMTEIGDVPSTPGDDQGLVWDYVIQTTATAIASGSFAVTGGASAISRGAVLALRCDYQTVTVTRSTNGIVASHAAGDDVVLTRPMRWGLV